MANAVTLAQVVSTPAFEVRDPMLGRFFPSGIRLGRKVLVLGVAGSGKSTFVNQLVRWHVADDVLWISLNESADVVRCRAKRFSGAESDFAVLTNKARSAAQCVRTIAERKPSLVVLDGLASRHPRDENLARELLEDAADRYALVLTDLLPTTARSKTLQHRADTVVEIDRRRGAVFKKNRLGPASEPV